MKGNYEQVKVDNPELSGESKKKKIVFNDLNFKSELFLEIKSAFVNNQVELG